MGVGDRGQAHTLEAFSAATVLLASVVFALQVTAVTPLTASTASQHIENQQAGVAGGLLDQAAATGELKKAVLYYNAWEGQYHNASGAYNIGGPPNEFGEALNQTFQARGIAFRLVVVYNVDGGLASKTLVDLGVPSDNAVTVHRTVVLYDDDHLYDWNGDLNTSVDVRNATNFYMTDQGQNSPVFNVVRVELTVWRM